MDSRGNAKEFLDIVDPSLVIFVKYDYWYHYLNEIKQKKINCLLISAVFRRDQSFFKWYGSLQRKMLRCFTQILVQNQESKALLGTIGIEHAVVAGDTRFDTVTDNARSFEPIPIVENFLGVSKCIVAGSTWSKDETHLQQAFAELGNSNFKLVVAPHQIDQSHLDKLKKLFPRSIKFSELISGPKSYSNNVLVIDNVGMLSRLYRYAHIAYVGGGFTKDGVHNVLEAAVFGKPVIFGNNYKKYREAIDLVGCGGASSFSDDRALRQLLGILFHDEKEYKEKCQASRKYVELNTGATRKIVAYIEENRLLTS